jgi:PAS domain S-box-containing protein
MPNDDQVRSGGAVHASGGARSGLAPQANELRVLHVEDDPLDAELVAQALRKGGFTVSVVVVQTEAEFERELRGQSPDVVLADYNLPQWTGMEALDLLRREGLDIPLILVTGALGDVTAVECIKRGATDYVLKGNLVRLPEAIRRALQEKHLIRLRRQVEQDLARKIEELTATLKDLADQKFALDQHAIVAVTNVQGTITYVNEKFCAISQYSREELIGQNHRIVSSGYHPKEFFQQMYQTIGGGQVWHGEMRNRAKDGSIYWVDATIVPLLGADGKPRQYIAIRADITERKQAEKEIQKLNDELGQRVVELARSNADLEQFAYVASHDLQEPLRMVAAYTQLLAERYRGKLDENAGKYIGYASEGALRMQSLIQDLLMFSRVGRNGGACGPVDCEAAMEEILLSLEPAIRESSAVVTHGALPTVWADRSRMTQVLQNLIGNAIKFRRKEAPAISVQTEKTGGQWLFSVSDNGIGIAPEHAENIFVVFQRLHTRTEYPGNGIGLAICKKIIEHSGGKIWVESHAGHGSIFKFTIPCDEPAQEEFCSQEMPILCP